MSNLVAKTDLPVNQQKEGDSISIETALKIVKTTVYGSNKSGAFEAWIDAIAALRNEQRIFALSEALSATKVEEQVLSLVAAFKHIIVPERLTCQGVKDDPLSRDQLLFIRKCLSPFIKRGVEYLIRDTAMDALKDVRNQLRASQVA